jgi:3-oxoacyl-ACP reductase-like protein
LNVEFLTFHRDDAPADVLEACGNQLPVVVAQCGDDLLVVLGPEELEALGGDVARFESELKQSCAAKGIVLD